MHQKNMRFIAILFASISSKVQYLFVSIFFKCSAAYCFSKCLALFIKLPDFIYQQTCCGGGGGERFHVFPHNFVHCVYSNVTFQIGMQSISRIYMLFLLHCTYHFPRRKKNYIHTIVAKLQHIHSLVLSHGHAISLKKIYLFSSPFFFFFWPLGQIF